MSNSKKDALSISRFKTPEGDLVDPATLSDDEYRTFCLAMLMKTVIEKLEMAVPNDRMFQRARYEMMQAFHDARDKINLR